MRPVDKRRKWRLNYDQQDPIAQRVADKLYQMGISYQQRTSYGVTEITARASATHQVRMLKHLDFKEVVV